MGAIMCGIELCYAVQTAFVTPVLLKLGLPHALATIVWCISPFLGFFLGPIMGSLSDRCPCGLGRRRPFIIVLSFGIVLGLILVSNGEKLGESLGDAANSLDIPYESFDNSSIRVVKASNQGISFGAPTEHVWGILLTILGVALLDFSCDTSQAPTRAFVFDVSSTEDIQDGLSMFTVMGGVGAILGYLLACLHWSGTWIAEILEQYNDLQVVFTSVMFLFIIGALITLTSHIETSLSELTYGTNCVTEETKRFENDLLYSYFNSKTNEPRIGQSSYGAIEDARTENAEDTKTTAQSTEVNAQPNTQFSEHLDTSVPSTGHGQLKNRSEVPIECVNDMRANIKNQAENPISNSVVFNPLEEVEKTHVPPEINLTDISSKKISHKHGDSFSVTGGFQSSSAFESNEEVFIENPKGLPIDKEEKITLKTYLKSILGMPKMLRILCLTNTLGFMSILSYILYFTDFVGQCVFGGSPTSDSSESRHLYDTGVRIGSLGMTVHATTSVVVSMAINCVIRKCGHLPVLVGSCLVYTLGAATMVTVRTPWAAIMFSVTPGIMFATMMNVPFQLVALYHAKEMFNEDGTKSNGQVRGIAADFAIMTSTVFLAQFTLSLFLGSVVSAVGSPVVVMVAAILFSAATAFSALHITYVD